MNEKIEEIFKDASERVKKQKEKQEEYWTKRSEQKYSDGEKKGLELAQLLQKNYKHTIRNIQSELYDFYGRYAKEGKLDLKEAKKLLSNSELTTFIESTKDIAEYAKQTNDEEYKKKLKLLRIKSQVTRLEELKTNIEYELSKLTNEGEQQLKEYLEDIYEDSYYRTVFDVEQNIGLAVSYTKLNQTLIEKAVSKRYQDTNYSIVIWKNKNNLLKILEQKIPQGLSAGWNPKKLAKIVDKQLNTGYNNTVRLIRTEYNLLANEATAEGYKTCGIEQYQILATLDNRTSEICQEMDLKVFDLKDKVEGINFPPFHPNCRTTHIPYFELDEINKEYGIGTRIARDKNGNTYEVPADMDYKEWKEQYVNNATNISTDNSNDSTIKESIQTIKNLKSVNIEYLPVQKLNKKLVSNEIIEKISGGDETKGSCSSVALAYIGNRNGLDVFDFRGGESQNFFSTPQNILKMCDDLKIKYEMELNYNDTLGAMSLLNKVEEGKEYYLSTGVHAAIVRKANKKLQYLELQDKIDNGFKQFTSQTLKKRFGCKQTHIVQGHKAKARSLLIDVDEFTNKDDFKEILGYINTPANKQIKGANGNAK